MARHRRQSPGDEGGVGEGGDANRSVISLANQIDVCVAEMKVDGDVRIKLEELRQNRRNAEHTKGNWRGNAYVTARRRRLRNAFIFRGFTFRKNMSGAVVKLTPSF